jgi:hypothetical protein
MTSLLGSRAVARSALLQPGSERDRTDGTAARSRSPSVTVTPHRVLQRDVDQDVWVDRDRAPGWPDPPSDLPALPRPLLETLYWSYYWRVDGDPGARKYLDNAFWGGDPPNLWEALRRIPSALDVILRVYQRWSKTSVPWRHVRVIKGIWRGTSDGFDFEARDLDGLEAALGKSPSFCKDHVGGLYHCIVEASTPCWREKISGSPGLHVCTGTGGTVHIDHHQCVSGSWPGGYCSYDISGSAVQHFKDLGWL